jgi:hypothetical protein
MSDEHDIERYRQWYRKLLRLYSRPYRERFAESMEQTFCDLCRERAEAGRGVAGVVLWMYCETFAGILKDNIRSTLMPKKMFRVAIIVCLILLLPLWGNFNVEGCNWSPFDFVAAFIVLFGAGSVFEWIASKGGTSDYRVAVGVACATGLVLLWINMAVGLIGSDDNPANLMYLMVLALAFSGACLAGFESRGTSRALFVTAAAQALVPVMALIFNPDDFSPGVARVFLLNSLFVAMWIVSALLFRYAGRPRTTDYPGTSGSASSAN